MTANEQALNQGFSQQGKQSHPIHYGFAPKKAVALSHPSRDDHALLG